MCNGKSGFRNFRDALMANDFAAATRLVQALGLNHRQRLLKIAQDVLERRGIPSSGNILEFEGEATGQLATWIATNLQESKPSDQPGVSTEVAMSIFMDTESPFFRDPPSGSPSPTCAQRLPSPA